MGGGGVAEEGEGSIYEYFRGNYFRSSLYRGVFAVRFCSPVSRVY